MTNTNGKTNTDVFSSADIEFESDDYDMFEIGLNAESDEDEAFLEYIVDENEPDINSNLSDIFLSDTVTNLETGEITTIDSDQAEEFNKKYTTWLVALTNVVSMVEANQQIDDFCKNVNTTIHITFRKTIEEVREAFYETLASECREKIKLMMICKNSFKQKVMKNDILTFIRKFIPDKEESRMVFTIYSAELEKAEIYNLEQLRELAERQEVKFLVKDYIPLGKMFLWTGAPKTGKTMIGSYLAVCIAQGKPFFNRETSRSNVLVIQNEEYIVDTTRKRFEAGIVDLQISDPELYNSLISEKKLLVARGLDLALDRQQIIDIVKENNISLVIVDSLGKSITNGGLTEQSPEITTVLYAIQEACFQNNFSLVILHHATKGGQEKETKSRQIDRVAGVNGITRAPDCLWFLEPSKKKSEGGEGTENQVDIKIIPRFGKSSSLTVERVEEEARFWSYIVVEESLLSEEEIKDICLIVKTLLKQYEPWKQLEEKVYPIPGSSLKELAHATKIDRGRLIKRINYILDDIGHYVKDGIRIYHIPTEGTCLEEYLVNEQYEQVKLEKLKASKLLEQKMVKTMGDCSTMLELKELVKDWNQEEKSKVWTLLTEENKQKLYLFIHPPGLTVGEVVTLGDESTMFTITRCYYNKDNNYYQYYLKDNDGNELNSPFLEESLKQKEIDNESFEVGKEESE